MNQSAKRILPGAGATAILWLLAAICKEPGVTEAAFPLLFLPLLSITSFVMAGKRASSLVGKARAGSGRTAIRDIAVATAAESIPFVVFFSQWRLNWLPFTVGVLMAAAIGGLAGTVTELRLPGGKIRAACLAAFLQAPSVAGLALIRHPLLLFMPNQGALELFDGAFGPLWGVELMMPLLAGSAWIALGVYTAAKIIRRINSTGKSPQKHIKAKTARTPSRS